MNDMYYREQLLANEAVVYIFYISFWSIETVI